MTVAVAAAPARIYLDNAATTRPAPTVIEAMLPHLATGWGNPSSVHGSGRLARAAVDDARDRLAAVLGCAQREIVFTSGGTEADNLAVRGVLERWGAERGRHVVVSAIEHEAVLATALEMQRAGEAWVSVVGVDASGVVDPMDVAAAVRDDTVLVSVMTANNEVGTIQPVAEIAAAVRRRNPHVLVHTDAVQAFGRADVSLDALGVDLLSLSAHKCHGPKGTGGLLVRWGTHLRAQAEGGGQERGRRSGTENVAGIAGFAAAAELVAADRVEVGSRLARLRDRLEQAARGASIRVACPTSPRLPFLTTLLVDGAQTDVLLAALDQRGVEVSGGSACSSGAVRASHVLVALGEDPLATAMLRCSLGRDTTEADIERAATVITEVVVAARFASTR